STPVADSALPFVGERGDVSPPVGALGNTGGLTPPRSPDTGDLMTPRSPDTEGLTPPRSPDTDRPDAPPAQGFWPLVPLVFVLLRHLMPGGRPPPPQEIPEGLIDSTPRIAIGFHDTDRNVQLAIGGGVKPVGDDSGRPSRPAKWLASMRFGLVAREGPEGRIK